MAKRHNKKVRKARPVIHPLTVLFRHHLPAELVIKTAAHLHPNAAIAAEIAAMLPGRDPTEHEIAQARECEVETREDEEWQDLNVFDRFDEMYGDLDEGFADWPQHDDEIFTEIDYANPHGLDWSREPEGRWGDL